LVQGILSLVSTATWSHPSLQGSLTLLRFLISFQNKLRRSSRPLIKVEYSMCVSGRVHQERIGPRWGKQYSKRCGFLPEFSWDQRERRLGEHVIWLSRSRI
jgi:hypothetical protein